MSDLDFLLKRLRYRFGRDYRGWIPTIGKNRVLAPVRGFPYVGGGGQGDPYVGGGGQGDPYVGGGAEGGSVAGTDQGDPYVGGGGAGDPQLSSPLVQWQPRASEPGSGVRVALLDTQLYPNPWLAGAYLAPTQALFELPPPGGSADPASLPKASQGHATFIAGLILHRAPGAQLYVRSVLNADALGDVWEAAKKMVEFTDSGVDIINLSFGCYTDDGHPPLVLARAVSRLSPEMIIVAAAGNHGNIDQIRADAGVKADQFAKGLYPTTPIWPAAFDDVIAVGAVDSSGKPAPFSPNLPWVDVTAPGVGVQSTYLTGRVLLESADPQTSAANPAAPAAPAVQEFEGAALWSGTSFAAANASGAIAACTKPGHRSARAALDSFMHPANGDVRPFFYSS